MKSFVNEYFAKKLKLLRTKYSKQIQKEIAFKLGMKQQNYSKLEKGETNFSDALVNKICAVFNITTLDFFSIQCQTTLPKKNDTQDQKGLNDYPKSILLESFMNK